jgi:hypothetical protein
MTCHPFVIANSTTGSAYYYTDSYKEIHTRARVRFVAAAWMWMELSVQAI